MPRRPSTTPTLFIVGGAEDRVGKASLLRQFVKLAGGKKARLVVIPTASSYQDDVAAAYTQVFGRIGVARVEVVNPADREEARDAAAVARVDDATGVFISGGSQLRLSQVFPARRWATPSTGPTTAAASSGAPRPGRRSCPTS